MHVCACICTCARREVSMIKPVAGSAVHLNVNTNVKTDDNTRRTIHDRVGSL